LKFSNYLLIFYLKDVSLYLKQFLNLQEFYFRRNLQFLPILINIIVKLFFILLILSFYKFFSLKYILFLIFYKKMRNKILQFNYYYY